MSDELYHQLFSWRDDNLEALIAAGIGGNSALAKRLRVKAQWRDRFGRWVKMGIGVKVKVRLPDGRVVSVIGKFVGASTRKGYGWIRVVDDPNVPNGYIEVESANAQEILASLDEDYLKDVGVEAGKDVDGNEVGVRDNAIVPNLSDLNRIDLETDTMAPPTVSGWKAMSPGRLELHKKRLVENARNDFIDEREKARVANPLPLPDEIDISEYVTKFSADVDEFFDSRFVYESDTGPSTIIVSPTSIQDFPGKLEATAEMLTNLERDYPVPGGVAVHITPFVKEMGDEAQKFGMISGGTAYSGGFRPEMEDNPYAIRIPTANFEKRRPEDYTKEDKAIDNLTSLVPAHFYQKGDQSRSVVAHEYGHVWDFATPREDNPELGGGKSEKVEKLAAEDPSVLDALGTYGRSQPAETVAETFAQMVMDRYDGLGRAQIDARLFDIVEQPVERAQLRGVRYNKDWSRVAEASPEFAQKYDQRGNHLAGPALDDARVDKHIAFLRSTGYDLDSTYEANFPAGPSGGRKKKTSAQLADEIVALEDKLQALDERDKDFNKNADALDKKIDDTRALYNQTKEEEDAAADAADAAPAVPDDPESEEDIEADDENETLTIPVSELKPGDVLSRPDGNFTVKLVQNAKIETGEIKKLVSFEPREDGSEVKKLVYSPNASVDILTKKPETAKAEVKAKARSKAATRAPSEETTSTRSLTPEAVESLGAELQEKFGKLTDPAFLQSEYGMGETSARDRAKRIAAALKPASESNQTQVSIQERALKSIEPIVADLVKRQEGSKARALYGEMTDGVSAKQSTFQEKYEKLKKVPDVPEVKKPSIPAPPTEELRRQADEILRENALYVESAGEFQTSYKNKFKNLLAGPKGDLSRAQLKIKFKALTGRDLSESDATKLLGLRKTAAFKALEDRFNAEASKPKRSSQNEEGDKDVQNLLRSELSDLWASATLEIDELNLDDPEVEDILTDAINDPEITDQLKALVDADPSSVARGPVTPATPLKPGKFADAPATGTIKTGTRKRLTSSEELQDAPVGTVIHRFQGNGTFDDTAYGTPGKDPVTGAPTYLDSIVKGEDGNFYRISDKTGKQVGGPLDKQALGRDANDTYGSTMVIDTPDDGSVPDTMYAQVKAAKTAALATPGTELTSVREINELPDGTQIIGTSTDGTTYTLTKEEGGRWTEGQAEVTNEDFQAFLDEGDKFVVADSSAKIVETTTDIKTVKERLVPVGTDGKTSRVTREDNGDITIQSVNANGTSSFDPITIKKKDISPDGLMGIYNGGQGRTAVYHIPTGVQFPGNLNRYTVAKKFVKDLGDSDVDLDWGWTDGSVAHTEKLSALAKWLKENNKTSLEVGDGVLNLDDFKNLPAGSSVIAKAPDGTLYRQTRSDSSDPDNLVSMTEVQRVGETWAPQTTNNSDAELANQFTFADTTVERVGPETAPVLEAGTPLNSVDELNSLPNGSKVLLEAEGEEEMVLYKQDGKWYDGFTLDEDQVAFSDEELQGSFDNNDKFSFMEYDQKLGDNEGFSEDDARSLTEDHEVAEDFTVKFSGNPAVAQQISYLRRSPVGGEEGADGIAGTVLGVGQNEDGTFTVTTLYTESVGNSVDAVTEADDPYSRQFNNLSEVKDYIESTLKEVDELNLDRERFNKFANVTVEKMSGAVKIILDTYDSEEGKEIAPDLVESGNNLLNYFAEAQEKIDANAPIDDETINKIKEEYEFFVGAVGLELLREDEQDNPYTEEERAQIVLLSNDLESSWQDFTESLAVSSVANSSDVNTTVPDYQISDRSVEDMTSEELIAEMNKISDVRKALDDQTKPNSQTAAQKDYKELLNNRVRVLDAENQVKAAQKRKEDAENRAKQLDEEAKEIVKTVKVGDTTDNSRVLSLLPVGTVVSISGLEGTWAKKEDNKWHSVESSNLLDERSSQALVDPVIGDTNETVEITSLPSISESVSDVDASAKRSRIIDALGGDYGQLVLDLIDTINSTYGDGSSLTDDDRSTIDSAYQSISELIDDTSIAEELQQIVSDLTEESTIPVDKNANLIDSAAELISRPDGSEVVLETLDENDNVLSRYFVKKEGRYFEISEDGKFIDGEGGPGRDPDDLIDEPGTLYAVEEEGESSGSGESTASSTEDDLRAEKFTKILLDFNTAKEELLAWAKAKYSIEAVVDVENRDGTEKGIFKDPNTAIESTLSYEEILQGEASASQRLQETVGRRVDFGELNDTETPFIQRELTGLRREYDEMLRGLARLADPKNKEISTQILDRFNKKRLATLDEITEQLLDTRLELASFIAFSDGIFLKDAVEQVNIDVVLNDPNSGRTPSGEGGGGDGGGGGGRQPGGGGGDGGGRQPDGGGGRAPAAEDEEQIPWYEQPEYQPDPTLPRLTRDDWDSDLYKTPEVIRAQELQTRYNRARQRYQALVRDAEKSKNMSDRDKMSLAWQMKVAEGESIIAEKKLKKHIANMSQADLAAYNRTRQPDEANAASLSVDELARTASLVQNKTTQWLAITDQLGEQVKLTPGNRISNEQVMSLMAEKARLEAELGQYTNFMLETEARLDGDDRNNWERWAFQESIRLKMEDPDSYRARLQMMQGMLPCVPQEECGDLAPLYYGRRTLREDFEGSGRRPPGKEDEEKAPYGPVVVDPLSERTADQYETMPLDRLLELRRSATAEYRDATEEIGDINNQISSVNNSIESAESVSDETIAALEALHERRRVSESRRENAQRIVAAISNASKNRADGGNQNSEAVEAIESEHREVVDARQLNNSRPGTLVAGYLTNDPTPRRFVKHLDGNWYQEDLYQNPILSNPYSANSLLAAMDTEIAPRFANNRRSSVPIAAIEGPDAGKFGPMWQHDNLFDTLDVNTRIIVADRDNLDPARLSASLYEAKHEVFIKSVEGDWYKIDKGGRRIKTKLSDFKKKQILDSLRSREKYGEISSPVQIPPFTGDPMEFNFPSDASPGVRRRRGPAVVPAVDPAGAPKKVKLNDIDKFTKVELKGQKRTQSDAKLIEQVEKIFGYKPTEEQLKIMLAVDLRRFTLVRAVAGAGKTTTLRMTAEVNPDKNITYVVFNKSNQIEAQSAFPANTQVVTSSSVYHGIIRRNQPGLFAKFISPSGTGRDPRMQYQKDATLTNPKIIAEVFNVPAVVVPPKVKGGNSVPVSSNDVATEIFTRVLDAFSGSTDKKLANKHFVGTILERVIEKNPELLLIAQAMWDDISTPVFPETRPMRDENDNLVLDKDGKPRAELYYKKKFLLATLTHFGKILQLDENFSITEDEKFASMDLFMMDEAQDMNPADTDIFFRLNKHRREEMGLGDRPGAVPMLVVGDPAQSMYGFRGSQAGMDAMADYSEEILPLSQTYRFGPPLAFGPNAFLALLGQPIKVQGGGGPVEPDGTYSPEKNIVYIDPQSGVVPEDLPEEMRPYVKFETPALLSFLEDIPRDPKTGFLVEKTFGIARTNAELLEEGIEVLASADSEFRIGAPQESINRIRANIDAVAQIMMSPEKRNADKLGDFGKLKDVEFGDIMTKYQQGFGMEQKARSFLDWALRTGLIPPNLKIKPNATPKEQEDYRLARQLSFAKAEETRRKWYIRSRQLRPVIPKAEVDAEKLYVDALRVATPEKMIPDVPNTSAGSITNLRGSLYGRSVNYEIWQSSADSKKDGQVTIRLDGSAPALRAFKHRLLAAQAKLTAAGKYNSRSRINDHTRGGFTISKVSEAELKLLFKELDKPARRYEPIGAAKIVVPTYEDLEPGPVVKEIFKQPQYQFTKIETEKTKADGVTKYTKISYEIDYKSPKVVAPVNVRIQQSGLNGYVSIEIDDWQTARGIDTTTGRSKYASNSDDQQRISPELYKSLGFEVEYRREEGRHAITFIGTQEEAQKILDVLRVGSPIGDPMTDRLDADVYFMTAHGAKGLEAENVYIMGKSFVNPVTALDKDGLPKYKTSGEIAEEAHGQFVAITRPENKIVMGTISYVLKIADKKEMGPDPKNVRAPKDIYFAKKTARGEAIPISREGIVQAVDDIDPAAVAVPVARVGVRRRNAATTTTPSATVAPVPAVSNFPHSVFPPISIPEGLRQYDFNGELISSEDLMTSSTKLALKNSIETLKSMLVANATSPNPDESPLNIYEALIKSYKLKRLPNHQELARKDLEDAYEKIRAARGGQSVPVVPATPATPAVRTRTRAQVVDADAANQAVALENLPNIGARLFTPDISPESLDQIKSEIVVIDGGRFSVFDAITRTGVRTRVSEGFNAVDVNGNPYEVPTTYFIDLISGASVPVPKDVHDNFFPTSGAPSAPAAPRVPNLPTPPVRRRVVQTAPATPATPAAPAAPVDDVDSPNPVIYPVSQVPSKISELGISPETAQEIAQTVRVLGEDMSMRDAINRFGLQKRSVEGQFFIDLDTGESIEVSENLYNNFYPSNPDEEAFFPGDSSGRRRGRGATIGESQISPDTMAEIFDRYALMAEYRKAIAQGRMSVPLEYSTGGVSNRYNAPTAEVLEALKLIGYTDEEINE